MKLLKILVGIIVVVVAGFFIYAMTTPKTFGMERSIMINASQEAVFEEVIDYNKWEAWSPWNLIDPNMVSVIEGVGLNSKMSWTSDVREVGNGSQTCIEVRENEFIRAEMYFSGDSEPGFASFTFTEMGDSTKVTWTLEESEMGLMQRGMMGLMDATTMIKNNFDSGLNNLKTKAEAKPKAAKTTMSEVVIEDRPAMNYIAYNKVVVMEDLADGAVHQEAYMKLGAFIAENSLEMAGSPFCIVQSYTEGGEMDLNFAFPVAEIPGNLPDDLNSGVVEAGKVAVAIHYGPYEEVGPTWEMIGKYIEDNGIEQRGFPYEQYMNDPSTLSDPSEIQTAVVHLIK